MKKHLKPLSDNIVAPERYEKMLTYDYCLNAIMSSLFYKYGRIFDRMSKIREHGLPNKTIELIDTKMLEFSMYASDSETLCIDVYTNKQLCEKKVYLNFVDCDQTNLNEFISDAVNLIEVCAQSSKETIPGDKSPTVPIIDTAKNGFIKKIKNIIKEEDMHRYSIVFDDNTSHTILCPNEIPASIAPGDYGYLDEVQSISFINKNLIQ